MDVVCGQRGIGGDDKTQWDLVKVKTRNSTIPMLSPISYIVVWTRKSATSQAASVCAAGTTKAAFTLALCC